MPFRARKKITIIPGILDLNLSGSASRAKGATGGHSFTWRLGRRVSYNTRDGRTRVNTPGLGWWESGTRSQRNRRRMQQAAATTGTPTAPRSTRSTKPRADPDAAAWAAHFAGLHAAGGREAAINSARAAGRCPGHGHVIPPGGMCPQCAKEGAQRHAAADARAAAGGGRHHPAVSEASLRRALPGRSPRQVDEALAWTRAQEARGREFTGAEAAAQSYLTETSEPGASRPQNAHGQTLPTTADGWPTGVGSWARSTPGQQNQDYRDRGLCGAPTKDGTNCLNYAGSCPHHRSGVLA